jgi:DNA-binding GntR family transcriptional regulator
MSPQEHVKPIERVPTSTLIADQLREAIMSGDFAQGEQVGEAALAEQFGVSRGPLREAMQRLVQEQLLESVPHRGLFVVTLSEEDIRDIYTARLAIETAAVLEIMTHDDSDASTRRLDRSVQRLQAAAERGPNDRLSETDAAYGQHAAGRDPDVHGRARRHLRRARRPCPGALGHRRRDPGGRPLRRDRRDARTHARRGLPAGPATRRRLTRDTTR